VSGYKPAEQIIADLLAKGWPSDPVDRALMQSDQRRSFIRGQSGHEAPPDVLADEVRRLRGIIAAWNRRAGEDKP
jgi:hypothetical protein